MDVLPYRFQLQDVRQVEKMDGRVLISHEMGLGKAQPLDAKILTPTGWITMGAVKKNDLVMGSNGHPYRVTGIFPQGEKEVFRIKFSDGSTTECCDDHLWMVNTPTRKNRGQPARVLPLSTIRNTLTQSNGNRNHYLPLCEPVHFQQQEELPVRPYLIGYLLANGNLSRPRSITVSIPDEETITRLQRILPDGVTFKKTGERGIDYRIVKMTDRNWTVENPLTRMLLDLNMMECHSYSKFIPKPYLYASVDDRKWLLRGLMDGDGTSARTSSCLFYCSASPDLAADVKELVQSLGGTCKSSVKEKPKYTYKGETKIGRPSHQLTISLPNEIKPFKLSRKAERYIPKTKYYPTKAFDEVLPIGKKQCQCIAIDAPDHLYITDDYVLTHNTVITLLYLKRNPELRPAVVICPASLKYQWRNEAAHHINMRAEILDGTTPQVSGFAKNPPLYIVNYDILAERASENCGPGWLGFLQELKPKIIILDESHMLGNRKAARSKAVNELCKGVPHVLALSGTPLTNRPIELWPTFNILQPEAFPSYFEFGHRFGGARKTPWGQWEFKGATRLDELHEKLSGFMIRRLKKDVLKELPAKQRIVIPFDITSRRQYNRAVSDFVGWMRLDGEEQGISRSKWKAQQLARLGKLKQLAGKLKLPAVLEWVDDFLAGSEEKIVLFAWHKKVIKILHERYADKSVVVDGSVTKLWRQRAVDKFQTNKKTRIFIGNIQAAGVGLNLTAASTVAFCELGWNPGSMLQAEDRCHRINQHNPVFIYYLIAKNTLEEMLLRLIQSKQKTLSAVLDNGEGEELGVYDQLIKEIMKGNGK